jgi:hypothetical protein
MIPKDMLWNLIILLGRLLPTTVVISCPTVPFAYGPAILVVTYSWIVILPF